MCNFLFAPECRIETYSSFILMLYLIFHGFMGIIFKSDFMVVLTGWLLVVSCFKN